MHCETRSRFDAKVWCVAGGVGAKAGEVELSRKQPWRDQPPGGSAGDLYICADGDEDIYSEIVSVRTGARKGGVGAGGGGQCGLGEDATACCVPGAQAGSMRAEGRAYGVRQYQWGKTHLDSPRPSARQIRVTRARHVALARWRSVGRGRDEARAAVALVGVLDAGEGEVARVAERDAGGGGVVGCELVRGDAGEDARGGVDCAGVLGRPVERD